ncbi:MAG: hypothetical protein Q9217_002552 [Psora testacea]
MASSADSLLVRVTAGPSYDPATHQTVQVNSSTPTHITSRVCTANVSVRIQNYRGLPRKSPSTSSYFTHPHHTHDRYSISFSLLPHQTISGSALVFGNDIDHPVRDRLPYGTGTAFKIVKSLIDPGLEGDLYADRPHLYGCALSSINVLRVGEKVDGEAGLGKGTGEGERVIEEGGEGEGVEWRKSRNVPEVAEARKKWFLGKGRAETWEWEEGRVYMGDFFNPYLDFNDFSLKLPGFSLSVLGYLGGEDYLRYVLKNKDNGDVLFVVVFSLLHKEEVEKAEGEAAAKSKSAEKGDEGGRHDEEWSFQPRADDLD